MEKLNLEIEKPTTSKWNWKTIIIIAVIIFVLAGIGIYFYDKWQGEKTAQKVEKVKTAQVVTKSKIIAKEKEIDTAAANHLKKMQHKEDQILQIQKNAKPKTIHYEKIIVESTDYDVMRDSLDIAMPE